MKNKIKKKNICFISTSRADYSYINNLSKSLKDEKMFNLDIIVSGSHFSKKFGYTLNEIKKNNFKEIEKIKYEFKNNDFKNIMNFSSIIFKNIDKIFNKIKPDCVIIIGDRFESLIFCLAAILKKIKIAHIGGGEITEGSADNYFRNAISQMSNLDFVSTKKSKINLINIGKNPKYIHHVGSLSLENINNDKYYNKELIEKKFNFKYSKITIMISYHPNTISSNKHDEINQLFKTVKHFKKYTFIFTSPNFDKDSISIQKKIMIFVNKHSNCFYIKSFGYKYYFSALKNISILLGNSSSGIIEAPSLGVRSVNIGSRQLKREKSESVINCQTNYKDIIKLIQYLVKNNNFKINKINPYYKKNTSLIIKNKLSKFLLKSNAQN